MEISIILLMLGILLIFIIGYIMGRADMKDKVREQVLRDLYILDQETTIIKLGYTIYSLAPNERITILRGSVDDL